MASLKEIYRFSAKIPAIPFQRKSDPPVPGFLRATTALHAASSAGAVAVVQRLLEARSAVAGGHGQLRALTPLHDAGTEEVALLLPGPDLSDNGEAVGAKCVSAKSSGIHFDHFDLIHIGNPRNGEMRQIDA